MQRQACRVCLIGLALGLGIGLGGCGPRRGAPGEPPPGTATTSSRMEVITIHECVPGDIKLSDGQCMTPVNPGSAETGGNTPPPTGGGGPRGGGGGGGDRDPPPPTQKSCQRCVDLYVNNATRDCRQTGKTREACVACVQLAKAQSMCNVCLKRKSCDAGWKEACDQFPDSSSVCDGLITQACSSCVGGFRSTNSSCRRLLRGTRPPASRLADCQRCYQAANDVYSECTSTNQCRDGTGAPPERPLPVDEVCVIEDPEPRPREPREPR